MTIRIHELPPRHVGLGTKTTLLLAVIVAVSREAGLVLADADMQALSGRGGTSGIGVHTFFCGGLVIDGGHRSEPPRTYLPSSSRAPDRIPPLIGRVAMPADWKVTLLLPEGRRLSGAAEEAFFENATPVPDEEVREALALAVMGLAASAASADLDTFSVALGRLQSIGFKGRERSAQAEAVRRLLSDLSEQPTCAVGMSSMGPLLFVVSRSEDTLLESGVGEIARTAGAAVLGRVGFRNKGFDIQ